MESLNIPNIIDDIPYIKNVGVHANQEPVKNLFCTKKKVAMQHEEQNCTEIYSKPAEFCSNTQCKFNQHKELTAQKHWDSAAQGFPRDWLRLCLPSFFFSFSIVIHQKKLICGNGMEGENNIRVVWELQVLGGGVPSKMKGCL